MLILRFSLISVVAMVLATAAATVIMLRFDGGGFAGQQGFPFAWYWWTDVSMNGSPTRGYRWPGLVADVVIWVVVIISVLALGVAYVLRSGILREPEGTEKMKEIARAIQDGSRAYLNRQFRTVALFAVVLAVLLYFALPVSSGISTSPLFATSRATRRRTRPRPSATPSSRSTRP